MFAEVTVKGGAIGMVQRKIVTTIDDLDGSEIPDGQVDVVAFSYRNSPTYFVELTPENAAEFDRDMQRWLEAGKRAQRNARRNGRVPVRTARPTIDREQSAAIRAWARKHGVKISSRGRIPQGVQDAYHAAGSKKGRT